MTTRLYLHDATWSGTGTVPSSEQSSLTAADNFEANDATNRSMSRSHGTSQTSLANSSTATVSQTIYYIGRWVSDPINQSGIAANTWTFNFAAKNSNGNANFPSSTGTQDFHLNIYVWTPGSGGSKRGTI